MKTKRIVLALLLIIIMSSIFIFSEQDGNTSKNTSDTFTSVVIDKITDVTKKEITKEKKKNLIVNTRFIVRKMAHFTVYLVLGILIYQFLSTFNINKIVLYSILFCLLYAITDEIHQLYSIGRTARVYDVIIDTIGSSLGIIVTHKIMKRTKSKKKIQI